MAQEPVQGWQRIAPLRPRLRSHARIHRHQYRDELWYVVEDEASGRYHRLTPEGYLIAGLMDGSRSVEEILAIARVRLAADAPGEGEVMQMLTMLYRADLILTDRRIDISELESRSLRAKSMRLKQMLLNPFALRFPLLDPDRLLERLAPLYRPLFSGAGLLAWLVLVAGAVVAIAMNIGPLTHNALDQVFSIENLLILWFVYPLVKALHEFGHACAVKAWGGEVHEMGVMVLVLMPIPYVDASAASGFASKRRRMAVGAAGMMVELALAALAAFVWVSVEPGLVRAIAYNVMLVAGISTVLFNANPLIRFDGYYILADWLETPNLAQRAYEYLGYLVSRHAFGSPLAQPPQARPGERAWLAGYAVASFLYRIGILVAIVLAVSERYFFIGVLLALWGAVGMLVLPVHRALRALVSSPRLAPVRRRAIAVSVGAAFFVGLCVFWVPAPSSLRTEGVIWAPEGSQVRAATEGIVMRAVAPANQQVRRGDVLLSAVNPEAAAAVALLEAQRAELDAQYSSVVRADLVRANVYREQLEHIEARLVRARLRVAELTLRSGADGIFILPEAENLPGRFVQRGELLGYVTDFSDLVVRAIVNQNEVDRVRTRLRRVEVRAAHLVGEIVPARVLREIPGATDQLPSLALSQAGGGHVGLDPAKLTEPRAIESLFLFDLELPGDYPVRRLGSRFYVRFVLEAEPLGLQWYRELRGLLLRRFAT